MPAPETLLVAGSLVPVADADLGGNRDAVRAGRTGPLQSNVVLAAALPRRLAVVHVEYFDKESITNLHNTGSMHLFVLICGNRRTLIPRYRLCILDERFRVLAVRVVCGSPARHAARVTILDVPRHLVSVDSGQQE